MPARTNAFQKLALHMQQQLAPDCEVAESAFLTDLITGDAREVDIVIRRVVAGQPLCIGIECIDHSRPATVEWVEKMMGKHQSLPTDVLVLVSASGFSDQAIRKARLGNVRAVALGDALSVDWTTVVGKSERLFLARFDFQITSCALLLASDGGAKEYKVGGALAGC